jgi:phage tail sheath protein FI
MAFQLSPGVNVSEIDLTTVIPSVATSTGAFVGPFAWGPCSEVTTISDETRLVSTFGKPNSDNYEYWFSAANFLAYGNNLKVVRGVNTAPATRSNNATANTGSNVLIRNSDDWLANQQGNADGTYGGWAARFPGALGNSLQVSMADGNSYSTWAYASQFTTSPNTSTYVASKGASASNDELHIVVVDEEGLISGTANTVLEKYAFVSKASDAKDDSGNSNYYKNVIAAQSKWIHWVAHPYSANLSGTGSAWGSAANNTSFRVLTSNVTYSFSGGSDGTVGVSQITTGWDLFKNAEAVDISLAVTGTGNSTVASYVISNIVESRKDCVAFISPTKANVVNNPGSEAAAAVAFRDGLTSSSYAVIDSGYKYQYDKYADLYRWIPLNGDIAGLCARTDNERDPWFSPGGMNRGVIKNVVKLAWNPTKTERDTLYVKGINPVVSFPGEGTVLFGDKTMLSKPSAFDRINVRRLFIVLEKAISRAARFSLFEFNDQFTRAQFVAIVEPFLRDVQGRRGITDFRVVCDDTNNTGQVIDSNQFIGDIYIKPARSINFIQLNFVAVRTGVQFNEVVGSF